MALRDRFGWINRRPWLVSLVLVTLVVVPGFIRLEQLNDDVLDTQVTSCEYGNDQRAANLKLWLFVIALSAADVGDDVEDTDAPSTDELELLGEIRVWVVALFTPRDCSDLDRKYPIPDPPPILDTIAPTPEETP